MGTFGSEALQGGEERLALRKPARISSLILVWFGLVRVVGHTWEVFRDIEWEGLQGKEKDRKWKGKETVGSRRKVKRAAAAAAAAFIVTL